MNENKVTYEDFLPLRDGLVEYASGLLKSFEDAQDIVQDLYLKLWNRRDSISEIENPRSYCMTVVRNRCLDKLNSSQVQNKTQMPSEVLESSRDIQSEMEEKEGLEATLAEIEKLPKGQRAVIMKRAVESLPYEQIGKQLGMNSQSMRTQMSLARKTLMKRVAWAFAALAIIAAVGVGILNRRPSAPQDTFSDPMLAYAELEKTFNKISSKIDQGMELARSSEPEFEKVEKIINKKY